jgi:hypothetical protein
MPDLLDGIHSVTSARTGGNERLDVLPKEQSYRQKARCSIRNSGGGMRFAMDLKERTLVDMKAR